MTNAIALRLGVDLHYSVNIRICVADGSSCRQTRVGSYLILGFYIWHIYLVYLHSQVSLALVGDLISDSQLADAIRMTLAKFSLDTVRYVRIENASLPLN